MLVVLFDGFEVEGGGEGVFFRSVHLGGGLATLGLFLGVGESEVLDAFSVEGAGLGGFGLADERNGDVLEATEVTVDLEFSGVVLDEVHWEFATGFWLRAGVEVGLD